MLVASGLAASLGEAKRHLREGHIRINGEVIKDESASMANLPSGSVFSLGAKKHAVLNWEPMPPSSSFTDILQ